MNKTDTSFWDQRRGIFRTKKGGWKVGSVISHGYSMLDDFLGKVSFFQILILHVTGRMPSKELADWLEASFICLSWPDPRILCNHIGSLGGSARTSSAAAVCAGSLAADSRIYGVGTLGVATRFIKNAVHTINKDYTISDFIEKECTKNGRLVMPGFARPLAKGDERVDAMQDVAKKMKFSDGIHLKLAYEISNYLIENYEESLNFAGYVVAFLCDQGFTEREIVWIFSLWVNAGVHACYVEAASRVPNSFLPLQCGDIIYDGVPERALS